MVSYMQRKLFSQTSEIGRRRVTVNFPGKVMTYIVYEDYSFTRKYI